jgi:hypothetical protein
MTALAHTGSAETRPASTLVTLVTMGSGVTRASAWLRGSMRSMEGSTVRGSSALSTCTARTEEEAATDRSSGVRE